jgi:hypothetical protein
MLARMTSIMNCAASSLWSTDTESSEPKTDQELHDIKSPEIQESHAFSLKRQSLSFIHLHRLLYLSLFDPIRTSVVAPHELNRNFIIVPFNIERKNSPWPLKEKIEKGQVSLAEIFNFDCMMRSAARQNPDAKLIICAGKEPATRARTVLLLGCHIVLSLGVALDFSCSTFALLHSLPGCPMPEDPPETGDDNVWCGEMTASSCWEALAAAKANRWIDFDRPFVVGKEVLCVEEYLHYSK